MVLSMKLISIAFDMDADIQKDLMNPKPKKTEERVEEIAISKKGMNTISRINEIFSNFMAFSQYLNFKSCFGLHEYYFSDLRRRKFIQSKTEESLEPPEVDQEFLILK